MTKVALFHTGPASEIGMLLINFLELRVVAGRSRTLAGRQHTVSGRPMLIHTYHAVPMLSPCRDPAMVLRGRFQKGIFVAWQGNGMGMAYVNQTRPHCVNQIRKTHGMAGKWHGMCESALIHTYNTVSMPFPYRSPATTLPWPWEVTFKKAYSRHDRGTAWYVWIKHGCAV
jgi:hypothetical protein